MAERPESNAENEKQPESNDSCARVHARVVSVRFAAARSVRPRLKKGVRSASAGSKATAGKSARKTAGKGNTKKTAKKAAKPAAKKSGAKAPTKKAPAKKATKAARKAPLKKAPKKAPAKKAAKAARKAAPRKAPRKAQARKAAPGRKPAARKQPAKRVPAKAPTKALPRKPAKAPAPPAKEPRKAAPAREPAGKIAPPPAVPVTEPPRKPAAAAKRAPAPAKVAPAAVTEAAAIADVGIISESAKPAGPEGKPGKRRLREGREGGPRKRRRAPSFEGDAEGGGKKKKRGRLERMRRAGVFGVPGARPRRLKKRKVRDEIVRPSPPLEKTDPLKHYLAGEMVPCPVGCGGFSEVVRISTMESGAGEIWFECLSCAQRKMFEIPAATLDERKAIFAELESGHEPLCPRHTKTVQLRRRGRDFVCPECGVRFADPHS